MKNILLPTDLTVQSLWPIHKLVDNANGEQLNIHLVHVLCIPTDFYELIETGKSNPRSLASQNFIEAYEMLRNKHKSIISNLKLQFIYGSSKRIIVNYMRGNSIDEICLLSNYFYQFNLKESVDFNSHLKQSKFPINSFSLEIENASEYQTFSTLLNNTNGLKEITRIKRTAFSNIFQN